ncbi:MAG: metallophosphoesterase [Halanaeroarchaeum sp.]
MLVYATAASLGTMGSYVLADRAVVLPERETLVLADLHLGRDATSEVELPLGERDDLRDRLAALLERFEPETVVLAGDVLHSFETVPERVPATIDALRSTVTDAGATVRVVAGNHDTMLASLVDSPVQGRHRIDDETVVVHGHELPDVDADRYVIGHEHPAIRIEGARHPCALDCSEQVGGASVFVLPSFTRLAKGTVVNRMTAADSMSPLLTDLDACRPIVSTDDGPLRFPPLGEFRDLL